MMACYQCKSRRHYLYLYLPVVPEIFAVVAVDRETDVDVADVAVDVVAVLDNRFDVADDRSSRTLGLTEGIGVEHQFET